MNYETPVHAETAKPLGESTYDTVDPDARGGRRRLYVIGAVIAILIAGAIAFAYMTGGGETATPAGGDSEQAPTISVITPGRATIEGTITATGTLAARRSVPVGVVGEGGRVVSVTADAGDWVEAGQVLVSIDRAVQNQQASAATAQIEVARADANLAQSNLDRALQLVDRGFISTADVDRLTATRDAAVARVRVAQAQASELRERNARLNVVAPTSGYVLERMVEPGQVVSAGSGALFTIARGGEMELNAQISETDLARLSVGVEATVQPAGTDEAFTGQIWQLAPVIDEQSRQGVARIALSYAPELRPGGFATARIQSGTVVAPRLPESAILSDDEGSFVYVVDSENKARRRAVTTGLVTQEGVAITTGLTGTERVVLRAGGFLTDGETVNPQKAEN
ncbi:efflux RND transporter periplasmic adaptor subunit [Qipengyuania sp. JC766]|uniref:efflux RND transporter periplasmic adaptor subunit n=1 Tax=Qipengyuania sp. JC766 TaxID=3232139 RepID=UPI0034595BD2